MATIKHLATTVTPGIRGRLLIIRKQSTPLAVKCLRFSTTKGPPSNLPANDNAKSLSTHDNRIFEQSKKLRSAILNDPPVLTKGFYPTAITNRGVYIGSTFLEYPPSPLPQLHAHALLDPKSYCKKSATASHTISGGDAARRLVRGRRHLMDVMRSEVHERSRDLQKLYVLRGHGVPSQLLHHHLHMARSWVYEEEDITEISVQNVFGALHFDRMTVRTDDGETRTTVLPKEWNNDMELYLTVMTRMANHLSRILLPAEEKGNLPRLKQWNVIAQAAGPDHYGSTAASLPSQLIPPEILLEGFGSGDSATTSTVVVVAEMVPMEGSSGRVSIRLQNHNSGDDQNALAPVAMVFDGIYDTTHQEQLGGM